MNTKKFLAKDSINSMSAIHCKIVSDNISDKRAVIRISDCHNSIKLHNDLNKPEEVQEFIEKINVMRKELKYMKNAVIMLSRTQEIKE
jgi:hypothetical protein